MRFAMCNELFGDRPLEQTCGLCADLGYAGLELAPYTFAPEGVHRTSSHTLARVRQTVVAAGLEVVGLHWLLLGPSDIHLASEDGSVRTRTADYLCALVDCCAELGGSVLVLGSPKQRNLAPGLSRARGLALAAETLAPAVRRAEAAELRWCLEPLPATDTNFLLTLRDCLELDRLLGGGPALGVQLDAKSLCAEASDPVRPASVVLAHAAHATRFGHFHANDRNLGAPGSGDVDFAPLLAALGQVGYDGWVSVEVFQAPDGIEATARDSIAYLRRVCPRR